MELTPYNASGSLKPYGPTDTPIPIPKARPISRTSCQWKRNSVFGSSFVFGASLFAQVCKVTFCSQTKLGADCLESVPVHEVQWSQSQLSTCTATQSDKD
ncbi:hypothetical protein FVEG_00001 [Fusarium verticillioides 7600]|uniref:Uncharacterized protein n=1 Tax=Gibberella moniliformis (strain M3125 / FGSC 7600) TaxID=334819 RepID=W7LT83_GIBM7|nr:hypothetical protein FVEG_00001 [Fusarium verticillioides 7600]EWG35782.1 hypothetical protein FVEG_00001 [Fusarium verticillioides 7600]